MQIFNGKPQFVDVYGERLVGGRLVFYKYATTDLADIFADPLYQTPLLNPLELSSAAWWSDQPFCSESVTVHVQEYVGIDEFNQPMYNDVMVYDQFASTSGTGGDTSVYSVVDTIEDLRALEPVDGALVAVKGYYTINDCYVREYIFEENNAQIDNGGTIIQSGVNPIGRWVLKIDDNRLDCRAFGVIAGIGDINSQIRAAQGWASDNDKLLYIPKGTYNYAAGGTFDCYAALEVDEDVKFNRGIVLDPDESNWYKWNLYNPNTIIRTTLAGVSVKLTINGAGWENTIVPITAFNNTNCRGYSHGSANYHLWFNTNSQVYTWEQNCTLSAVSVIKGYTSNQYINTGVTAYVDHLEGDGLISFNQTDATWFFRELRTKYVSARVSYAMVNTSDIIHLDCAITLHSGADITAYVEASGLGTLNTPDGTCKMRGGYGGKPNFILTGYGLDVGYHTISQDYFASANGLVNTWNYSTSATGILDMGRAVSTETITRAGIIYNGTIGAVSAGNITLDNVTVNGNIDSTDIDVHESYINGSLPNLTSSKIRNTTITTTSTVNCSNAVWTEVTISGGNIQSIGGSFRLRDVFCNNATFIPNSSKQFANASWFGGSAVGISFDSTQMSVEGEALGYNIAIKNVVYLPNNIVPVNGTTKKWQINGHYNIQICDNEGPNTKKTEGGLFTLLKYKYNQLNSNSTLAGWVIGLDSTNIFQFNAGTTTTPLQIHYVSADKAADLPSPFNQYNFFPANVYKPYPLYHIEPSAQITGTYMYMRFYVGAGATFYSNTTAAYANPGTVDSQHYFVNFKIYP